MSKKVAPRLREALALQRQGRWEQAEILLRRLLDAQPENIEVVYQLALLKTETGAFTEAHYFATAALELDSRYVAAHALLGRILVETGAPEEALARYAEALAIQPGNAEALFGRGLVLQRLGRPQEALDSYAAALAAAPEQAEAWCNHGNVLFALKRFEEALHSFEEGIKRAPGIALLHFNRANTLGELGRVSEALRAYDHALAMDSGNPDIRNNRGNLRLEAGDVAGATEDFRRMIAEAPGDPRGYNGLGQTLQEQGDHATAALQYERAIRLEPGFSDARHNLALARLYQRDFAGAWPEYEHRCDPGGYRASLRKDLRSVELFERLPRWKGPGGPASGTVGIWCEQGIGDQVLFSTLLPELKEADQRFVYEVDGRLLPAYRRAFLDCSFVALADPPDASLQTADSALFSGSLPGLFRRSLPHFGSRPRSVLRAEPGLVAHYRRQFGDGFRVALSWRSLRSGRLGRNKSAELADFSPLLAVSGVQGVDIQYGDTRAEREALVRNQGLSLAHFDDIDYRDDLENVLAILEACDLLITTSNANAHFAGALGKPVWLLYPAERAPFHYWAHAGDHRCLWYPSVEIISAPELTDWKLLVRHAAEKLAVAVAGARRREC